MSSISVNTITDASGGSTTSINGFTPSVSNMAGRNRIINGAFDIWQRGTSFTSSSVNEYSADRFRTEGNTLSTTISRQSFTAGQTDVPSSPTYYCRVQTNSAIASGQYWSFQQRVEAPQNITGYETVTLSFWVRAVSGTIPANTFSYGCGGNLSLNPEITTTWQKVTKTQTLTGADGGGAYVSVYLVHLAGNAPAVAIDIANVQLEEGSVATPFEHRQYGQELALCQRYYYRITPGNNLLFGSGIGRQTTRVIGTVVFPVPMRTAPSALEQTGTAADYAQTNLKSAGADSVCSSVPAFGGATTVASTVNFYFTSGIVIGSAGLINTASANSFLGFPAEL